MKQDTRQPSKPSSWLDEPAQGLLEQLNELDDQLASLGSAITQLRTTLLEENKHEPQGHEPHQD